MPALPLSRRLGHRRLLYALLLASLPASLPGAAQARALAGPRLAHERQAAAHAASQVSRLVAAAPLAIFRTEPLELTRREQDALLLDAPDADLSRLLSQDERERFHAYRRPRWMRAVADLAIQLFLFYLLLMRGLSARLYASSERLQARLAGGVPPRLRARLAGFEAALDRLWGSGDWPTALLFASSLAALGCLSQWPTSLVFDWVLPRQHGLSNQTFLRWLQLSSMALTTQLFGLSALAFGLWGLLRRVRRVWLWLGVPAGVLVALAGLADPLTLQMRNQLVALPAGPQRAAIEEVLQRAGLGAEEIDRIDAHRDTLALDAFITGQGATRRIVLFDTLLDALSPPQLAAVVAHELGHLRDTNRLVRATLAGLCVPLLLWLGLRLLERAARKRRFGIVDAREVRALPLLLCLVFLAAVSLMPLSNRLARERELRADLFALDLTRDPASLRTALLQLARKNQLDPAPPALVAALLYDHPTLAKRLGLIDAWEEMEKSGER